jgi:hypothetical protein
MRTFHDDQLRALKEAIRNVFWTRDEFRKLFARCGVPPSLIARPDWNSNTWTIVDTVIEALNELNGSEGIIRSITQETLRYKNGQHLAWSGEERVRKAGESLKRLREVMGEHEEEKQKKAHEQKLRDENRKKREKGIIFNQELSRHLETFKNWFSEKDASKRGFAFELLLGEIFDLFDLAPKGAFRRKGEQIDGGFKLDNENYLLEAKWQAGKINLNDLRDLDGAVSSTIETTLGLFLSVNEFSADAIETLIAGNRPRIICMDGQDLMLVLEGRIDLQSLLRRKKEIAAQRRLIYVTAKDILEGKF